VDPNNRAHMGMPVIAACIYMGEGCDLEDSTYRVKRFCVHPHNGVVHCTDMQLDVPAVEVPV
jgi:hypothetical protein